MRYVLSTFVVVPKRWIDTYGWRPLTPEESLAVVRYQQALGRRMGIKSIPATYDEFEQLLDSYEAEHFAYDPGARRVAESTLDLLASFYPFAPTRMVKLFARAVMDRPLLDALGYDIPPTVISRLARGALKVRARLVSLLPPRRRPKYVSSYRRVRSYPNEFDIAQLGSRALHDVVIHKTA